VSNSQEPVDLKKGRKRKSPPKLRPGGTSSAISLEYNKPVNQAEDIRTRPLVGMDIALWRDANSLDRLQVVQMLAMPTPHSFNRITTGESGLEPLSFDMEMLLRFYMRRSTQVTMRQPADVFNKIYGPLLAEFPPKHYEAARVMLYSRFGALLGRTVFSAYRWFKTDASGGYGGASGSLRRLLSQLPDDPRQMREELESLARQTFKARGYDLDELFPLPDPSKPPVPSKVARTGLSKVNKEKAAKWSAKTRPGILTAVADPIEPLDSPQAPASAAAAAQQGAKVKTKAKPQAKTSSAKKKASDTSQNAAGKSRPVSGQTPTAG
jgi:hypothetical protein